MRKLLVIAAAVATGHCASVLAADDIAASVMQRAEKAFVSLQALARDTDGPQRIHSHWMTRDVVYQYALSEYGLRATDLNFRLQGRGAVAEHLAALAVAAPSAVIDNVRVFPTLESDVVFVQYDLVSVDGRGKLASPLAIIQMQGDRIAKFTQLVRAPATFQALTAPGKQFN